MFKPLELFIGLRYTRAKRRNHFISFISLASMLGIAIGVWALIVVLSVVNGFQKEVRDRMLGMSSHITVQDFGEGLRQWPMVAETMRSHPDVTGAAPYIRGEGMVTMNQQVQGVIVRGVMPAVEPEVSIVSGKMVSGDYNGLEAGRFRVVIGSELASLLSVDVGDKLTLVTPTATVGPAGVLPRMKRFTVAGIFEVGMHQYDSGMIFVHMEDAARLYRVKPGMVTGVRLSIKDMYQAPLLKHELSELMGNQYWVSDWTYRHANYFRALKIEKTMLFVILSLIVAVAAFNIVSTLVMVVTDKQSDIAILRTLGMSPRSVMAVFMVQGTMNGLVGTLIGGVVGVITALNIDTWVPAIEEAIGIDILPASVYYISELPSDMHWDEVGMVCTIAFVMSVLSTLYPAWRGAKTQPAEALRYE
ncbi:MAG: lipoprotein-releasing ABC transporter permease subunit [Gammaproteobacteria bacterium]|nr:lipoprotein-releasing ABC transporter permease subunit [Gammaproteobacteria bacterium]